MTIAINFNSLKETSNWALGKMSTSELVQEWSRNVSYSLMDFWYYFTYFPNSSFNFNFAKYLIPILLIFIGYSFYFLCRQTPLKVSFFILALINRNFLPMTIQDLLSGGYRSIMARYFVPCYLGIHLSVAYLFARKIQPLNINRGKLTTQLWKLCFGIILIGGILSCTVSSQSESWWNKRSWDHILISKIVNQTSHSLLILESDIPSVLSISHEMNSDVKFGFITNNQNIPRVPDEFNDVFLSESSKFPINKFGQEQQFNIKLIYTGRKQNLWKLEKKRPKMTRKEDSSTQINDEHLARTYRNTVFSSDSLLTDAPI